MKMFRFVGVHITLLTNGANISCGDPAFPGGVRMFDEGPGQTMKCSQNFWQMWRLRSNNIHGIGS
jgi:hypothetical protein